MKFVDEATKTCYFALLVDDTLILETGLTSKHTLIVCRPHPPRTKVNILSELFSVPSVLYLMRTVSIYW
jgi:hypothetical protein